MAKKSGPKKKSAKAASKKTAPKSRKATVPEAAGLTFEGLVLSIRSIDQDLAA